MAGPISIKLAQKLRSKVSICVQKEFCKNLFANKNYVISSIWHFYVANIFAIFGKMLGDNQF